MVNMIQYRITKADDHILQQMGETNWQLISITDGKMYFSKKSWKTRDIKTDKESSEWLEFITLYRKINNNGSYAKTLVKKYHECLKEKDHKYMMDKLREYQKHLEAFTSKPTLQVSTYLNQWRYNDTYELIKVDYVNKWKDDMLKEQEVPQECIDAIMSENNKWVSNHWQMREMTAYVFQEIIGKYYVTKAKWII